MGETISMTNAEAAELQELRRQKKHLDNTIWNLQYELDDNKMRIEKLEDWKRFRWLGFLIVLAVFAALFVFALIHMDVLDNSAYGNYYNPLDTIATALSTSSMLFAGILLLALLPVMLKLGFDILMELGGSELSRTAAKKLGKKNYYNEQEKLKEHSRELGRALYDEQMKLHAFRDRLSELEELEKAGPGI